MKMSWTSFLFNFKFICLLYLHWFIWKSWKIFYW